MPLDELPATYVTGIDGCAAGWIVIGLDETSDWEGGLFEDLPATWTFCGNARLSLIDIPIGLPGTASLRVCDREARRLLGPRRSSVFPPPVRTAAYAASYREACMLNAKATGKKISIQAWNITPKIREADQFLQARPEAAARLLEAHPEINFLALTGGSMVFNKKTPEGQRERLDALLPHCPAAADIYAALLDRYRRKDVARDDLLDALCLAVNARLSLSRGLRRLPADPPVDAAGLPMQIVCADTFNF